MTSKVMVPIVREPEGGYTANFLGKQVKISEEAFPTQEADSPALLPPLRLLQD